MPPNVTPLIQPMDQNVIRLTKLHYKKALLSSIVASNESIYQALRTLTIKDAILNLALAWEKVPAEIIEKCWKNILKNDLYNIFEEEDEIPLSVLKIKWQTEAAEPELSMTTVEVIDLLNTVDTTVSLQLNKNVCLILLRNLKF